MNHRPARLAARLTAAVAALGLAVTGLSPIRAGAAVPEVSAAQLAAANLTWYFANAGATDTSQVAEGDRMGVAQSRSDQPLGADPVTGATWGIVSDELGSPRACASTSLDKYASCHYDAEPAGADLSSRALTYRFEVPAGQYRVTWGFKAPSGWGSRPVVLTAEGTALQTLQVGTTAVTATHTVEASDGSLDVQIASPQGRTDVNADPFVNFVTVQSVATAELLDAKLAELALSDEQAAGYGSKSLAAFRAAEQTARGLVAAGSTDATALQAAFDQLVASHAALREIVTYDSFRPGQPWLDSQAEYIQAHGGQVVVSSDDQGPVYYWYGEDRSKGYHNSPGVHVYQSRDLYNWDDKGLALKAMTSYEQFTTDPYFAELYAGYSDEQLAGVYRDLATTKDPNSSVNPAILERPKVIHNATTGKWVMWVHADGPSATSNAQYAKANAGVAISDSPFGPFRYIESSRLHVAPAGEPNHQPNSPGMARDMNLFVDDDGTGYIIYSSEENYSLFISKLDETYTRLATPADRAVKGVDFIRPYIGAHREAPAMFKFEGVYYLITSGATGWDPNPARYATATEILGEWTDRGNPVVGEGASTTWRSQSTSVIPVDPAKGRFIYMGDRWTPSDLATAPYVWLPIRFGEGGSMTIPWHDEWTLDELTPQQLWSVDVTMPATVQAGAANMLPAKGMVTENGTTRQQAISWDTTSLSTPGHQTITGRLADGRTFTRQVLVVPKHLRYVVNSGGERTSDWQQLMAVADVKGEVINTVPDQPLGADPGSGATWGYTSEGSQPRSTQDATIDTNLRYATGHRDITYTFTGLQPGKSYDVFVGYYDPWPWANRAAKVTINGTVVDAERLFSDSPSVGSYLSVRPDAKGTVVLTITPTRSPDIQVSWVMVARQQ